MAILSYETAEARISSKRGCNYQKRMQLSEPGSMVMIVLARNWTWCALLQSVRVDVCTRILGTRIVPITRSFIESI